MTNGLQHGKNLNLDTGFDNTIETVILNPSISMVSITLDFPPVSRCFWGTTIHIYYIYYIIIYKYSKIPHQ